MSHGRPGSRSRAASLQRRPHGAHRAARPHPHRLPRPPGLSFASPPRPAGLQADIRRWPPGHPLSQQFPKRSLLPGAGESAASRGGAARTTRAAVEGGGGWGRAGAFTRSHEGEGEGRAIATLRGSWAPWKPAAPSHVLQPALGGKAGTAPRAGGEERRGPCWERPQAKFLEAGLAPP